MAGTKTSRAELKSHFQKGDYPTENDFANVFESYVHKDDDISASKVSISDSEGNRTSISTLIDRKADKSIVSAHDKRLDDAENDIATNALDIQATERTAYKILAILGKKDDESIDAFVARINALGTDYSTFATLAEKLRDFLDGTSDVDGTINKWQEIETFLQGITETDSLAEMLGQMQRTIEEQIPTPGDYLEQVSELPLPERPLGAIIQYTGETKDGYTQGYIYRKDKADSGPITIPANTVTAYISKEAIIPDEEVRALVDEDPYFLLTDESIPYMFDDNGHAVFQFNEETMMPTDGSGIIKNYTHHTQPAQIDTIVNPVVHNAKYINFDYANGGSGQMVIDKLRIKQMRTMRNSNGLRFHIGNDWYYDSADNDRHNSLLANGGLIFKEDGSVVQCQAGDGDSGLMRSADTITIERTSWTRIDVQPQTAIPTIDKAGLSDTVQTSLGKADTALQLIEHGADGQYISTTISAKASNKQSVSSALAIQPVETADIVKKGVAEAYDVKTYVDGKVQTLAEQIYDETVFAYGVEWSLTSGSPECTRLGNPYYHKVLPIHSRMIGGLMTDDGTFTPFRNQSDWTSETRDGSAGQVMVEIPEFYIKYVTLSDRLQVWMSERPLYGYQKVDKMYIGAYEATVQRSANKLCSVANTTADYRGGNNNASWDSENTAGQDGESHRSLLGRPATYISLTQCRTMARNRNNGDTRWNCKPYEAQKIIYWLYVVEYATLNSQKAYNSQKSAEGFAQGGLGEGVTTWDGNSWNSYNGYYPFVPCGYTDHLGNRTGTRDYTIHNSSGGELKSFLASQGSGAIRYRGIENPFGHIWEWTDGVLVNVTASTSPVYICKYPSLYSSTDFSHYDYIGDEMRVEQFLREILFGDNGDITAKSGAGSSNTFYCDYHYANVSSPSLRGLLWGGFAVNGALAGLVCSHSTYVPSLTYPNVGSRLCFKA